MTLSKSILVAASVLVSSLCGPVAAQDSAADGVGASIDEGPPDTTIIVTGQNQPVSIRQIRRQARDIMVRTGNIYESPLARFEDRLCPGIVGLEPDFAALMIDRVRTNAALLDIRLMPDGCDANFIIAFVDDGEAMLRRMMEESPQYFQYLDSGEKHEILQPGPAHVWANVEPRTLTGMPIAQVRNLVNPPRMHIHAAHSRIYTPNRNDITSVMITFDTDAVRGLNLGQLADYATMRGLAQTRPSGDMAIDSILSLFAHPPDDPNWAPPQRLTEFDRAYLRSLYAGPANLPASRKMSNVDDEMLRTIAQTSEVEE